MTEPLVPANCELLDFRSIMIDIARLQQSEFDAIDDDSAWRAGVNLWFASWHRKPAGSLPAKDSELAKAAGLGRDARTWARLKPLALKNWTPCSDGLLYHPVVCETVLNAWLEKLGSRLSSGFGNATRYKNKFDPAELHAEIVIAADCLARLDPRAKCLSKGFVLKARAGAPPSIPDDSEAAPTGSPPGSQPDADGIAREGKGSETPSTKVTQEANASFVCGADENSQSPPNRSPRSPKQTKGSRLSPSWLPAHAEKQFASNAGLTLEEITNEAAKFVDYWCAKSGSGATKVDWGATWRNWARTAVEQKRNRLCRSVGHGASATQPANERRANTDSRRDAWAELIEGDNADNGRNPDFEGEGPGPRDVTPRLRLASGG